MYTIDGSDHWWVVIFIVLFDISKNDPHLVLYIFKSIRARSKQLIHVLKWDNTSWNIWEFSTLLIECLSVSSLLVCQSTLCLHLPQCSELTCCCLIILCYAKLFIKKNLLLSTRTCMRAMPFIYRGHQGPVPKEHLDWKWLNKMKLKSSSWPMYMEEICRHWNFIGKIIDYFWISPL
jgi:hypothetical protein